MCTRLQKDGQNYTNAGVFFRNCPSRRANQSLDGQLKYTDYLLNSTVWSNYTWPAWLRSLSTWESTQFCQSNLLQSDFKSTSPRLPLLGEAHCKSHQAWQSTRSPLISSCLRSILSYFPCLLTIREPGWPSENIQSTDTASEIIATSDMLQKLWIF